MTDLKYEEITLGTVYLFERVLSEKDERLFAELTGDTSFLCSDGTSGTVEGGEVHSGRTLVHGLLTASLLSTLIDGYCPGPKSLYISQSLQFRKPLFYGEKVTVKGIVIGKSDSTRILTLKTEILRGEVVVISGEAEVQVLE